MRILHLRSALLIACGVLSIVALSSCVDGLWMPFDDMTAAESIVHAGNPSPVVISSNPRVAPGQDVTFFVPSASTVRQRIADWQDPQPETRTIVWVPPYGVTGVTHSLDPQPGGPPYVFPNVAANETLILSHKAPVMAGRIRNTFFMAYQHAVGESVQVGAVTKLTTVASSARMNTDSDKLDAAGSRNRHTGAANAGIRLVQTVSPSGAPLDSDLCEDLRSGLDTGKLLVALRVPLQVDADDDTNVPLPMLVSGGHSQSLEIVTQGTSDPPVVTATLGYAPAHFTALSRQIAAAEDEYWLALQALDASSACPANLAVAADTWDLDLTLSLDADNLTIDYERRGLLTTYCWVGTTSPFERLGLRADLRRFTAESGEPVTCFTPVPVSADPDPDPGLRLTDVDAAYDAGTRQLAITEVLHNDTSAAVAVEVDYASDLGSTWTLWRSDTSSDQPGTQVSAGQLGSVGAGAAVKLWFLTTVPADIEAGGYSLDVTATSPDDAALLAWDTVPFWVGDWVPTILEETGGTVFLPLVIKGR